MITQTFCSHRERGSALIVALFLLVIVGALGVFAVRMQSDQTQLGSLQVSKYRATAAAQSGLEYWSYQVFKNNTVQCPSPPIVLNLNASSGLRGFSVTVSCVRVMSGANAVYEVTASARNNATYGSVDFVQRTLTRRVSPAMMVY